MKELFRQSAIIVFAFLVLFSTTGVAFYHHICGCPVPTAQPAISAGPAHNCCSDVEIPAEPACCTDEDHDVCDAEQHDECKNEVTYLKAPIIFVMPVQELAVSEVSFEMPDFRMPDAGFITDKPIDEQLYTCDHLIPPRADGSLFILLHSIKIPSPEDIA